MSSIYDLVRKPWKGWLLRWARINRDARAVFPGLSKGTGLNVTPQVLECPGLLRFREFCQAFQGFLFFLVRRSTCVWTRLPVPFQVLWRERSSLGDRLSIPVISPRCVWADPAGPGQKLVFPLAETSPADSGRSPNTQIGEREGHLLAFLPTQPDRARMQSYAGLTEPCTWV